MQVQKMNHQIDIPNYPSVPPGFIAGPLLDKQLIDNTLDFLLKEPRYPWKDISGNVTRFTINYGWDYVAMEEHVYNFKAIPAQIIELRKQLINSFQPYFRDAISPEDFDNIIVSIYEPTHYLIPHYDVDNSPNPLTKRDFHFGEPIIGLILQADSESRFSFFFHDAMGRPSINQEPLYQVKEQCGTTFLMQGECRHFPYFHGVPPTKNLRISVTMRRTIIPPESQPSS